MQNKDVMMASLDHAMWFHNPPRADEWILVDAVSPFARQRARPDASGDVQS